MLAKRVHWAWWAVIGVTGFLLASVGATVVLMNNGPLPAVVARTITSQVEKSAPVLLDITDASFVGPTKLRLSGVTAIVAQGETGDLSFSRPIRIRQVHLEFNPYAVLRGDWAAALRRVELVEPQVELAYDPAVAKASSASKATKGNQDNDANATHPSPLSSSSENADSRPGSSGMDWPEITLAVKEGRLTLTGLGANKADTMLMRHITAQATSTPKGVQIDALKASGAEQSQIVANGSVTAEELAVKLSGSKLQLPRDLPFVTAWGISGEADFAGEVVGTLSDPKLKGLTTIRQGTLWQQPITQAKGEIGVSKDEFRFDKVRVTHGSAQYDLAGKVWGWDEAGHLDISLTSNAGRVEELLGILELPIQASGRLDGTLRFSGPFEDVLTAGQVQVASAQAFDERFDYLRGGFRWGNGKLQLNSIQAGLGQGTLTVNGYVALDGSDSQVDLESKSWPLGQVSHLSDLVYGLGGAVSTAGLLSGPLTDPNFAGRVEVTNLRAGSVSISRVEGPVKLAVGTVSTSGMDVTTTNGGSWRVTGDVQSVLTGDPQVDVAVRVEEETLSSLLAMGGVALPVNLVDGVVQGQVDLAGTFTNPQADLDLYLANALAGAGNGLRLQMKVADRRVRLLNIG